MQKFTNTGTLLATWGSPGCGDGQFNLGLNFPALAGVAVDASVNVFVADGNNRIQKFACP
jgi:hypothetical protein